MPGIVWWEVERRDPEAFRRFRTAMFGWTFVRAFSDTELGADYWLIQAGDDAIGGLQRAVESSSPPVAGTRISFGVDDLEAALDRAAVLGGSIERGRTALGGADRWFGTLRDSTGVSFGLWTQNDRGIS
jgi:predicted enzyme related to lactoylglutathione lyase